VLLTSQTAADDTYSSSGLFRYVLDGKTVESGITVTDLGTGRGLHSFPFPLNLSLLRPFPLNFSSLCPPHNPNQLVDVCRRCSS